eukprot:scaffold10251_cov287-Chaetoceros_neogracile.AAC.4
MSWTKRNDNKLAEIPYSVVEIPAFCFPPPHRVPNVQRLAQWRLLLCRVLLFTTCYRTGYFLQQYMHIFSNKLLHVNARGRPERSRGAARLAHISPMGKLLPLVAS